MEAENGYVIWQILRMCKIRHREDFTNVYELCAEEADDEGLSGEEKYMRCEGFRGFGK